LAKQKRLQGGIKKGRKGRSPWVDELRDPVTNISTENHHEMTDRLVKAGRAGIHNHPGDPHKGHQR